MLRAEKVTDGPIGEGTQFRAETATRRGSAEMAIEITRHVTNDRAAESSTRLSNMDITGALTFDPVPEGTRMQWVWDVRPRGVLKLMGPIISRMGERQERTIWTNLKRVLEHREKPPLSLPTASTGPEATTPRNG